MAPTISQLNRREDMDTVKYVRPEVYVTHKPDAHDAVWPDILSLGFRRRALFPPTDDISPLAQRCSAGTACPVGPGPAGTVSHRVHGSHGIWGRPMETAQTLKPEGALLGFVIVGAIYLAAMLVALVLCRLLACCKRGFAERYGRMQAEGRVVHDADAPWQASWEFLEDGGPRTISTDAPKKWEEDALTICEEDHDTW